MDDVGKHTRTAICANCGNPIVYIEWGWMENGWSHDMPNERGGGQQGLHCPGQYTADPRLGTIEEVTA